MGEDMNAMQTIQHVASSIVDPDKAPVLKLSGAAIVGTGKLLGLEVPELIAWATLVFFVLQIAWILWRMWDKFVARWKGTDYKQGQD